MAESRPVTRSMTIAEVKTQLSRLVGDFDRKPFRILVEDAGVPVAAIISVDDLARFAQLERERDERFAVIDRMREAFQDVPVEEIEQEAQRSITEARDRLRQRADELAAHSA